MTGQTLHMESSLTLVIFVSQGLNDHAQVRQNPWIPKDLQPVTDAVIHALSSTNPKASYIVGGVDAKVLSRVALLPSYLADKLLRIMVKGTAVEVFPGPSPNAQAQHHEN